jgi:hypothetical protein
MKLLSDFDGVWTQPAAEAEAQGRYTEETLVGWAPSAERGAWSAWLAQARSAVLAEPGRYGWAPGGKRLSTFADEDPFTIHSALLHYLQLRAEQGDPVAAGMRSAMAAQGFADVDTFGGHAHVMGVERVVALRGPGILPDAAAAGHQLLADGVEVVVVSNSAPEKLTAWFGHAGLPHTLDPERRPGHIRLRGGAAKFQLDPERTEPLRLGAVEIDVARPRYRAILEDERPEAVVGDVVSLDLALPLALKRSGDAWRGLRLFWLVRSYAPAWLAAEVRRGAGAEIELVAGGLGEVARRLRSR